MNRSIFFVLIFTLSGCLVLPRTAYTSTPSYDIALHLSPSPEPLPSAALFENYTDKQGILMKLIPAGWFEMGGEVDVALNECLKLMTVMKCKEDWFVDETPKNTVFLDTFYVDLTEVTNSMYQRCVEAGACTEPSEKKSFSRDFYYGNAVYVNYPVIYVSWEQASSYCSWRGARLPYEAEWEKAARGTDGRLYPWGNYFDGSQANFCDTNCINGWANRKLNDGQTDTALVGSYNNGISPYGLMDMAGNVWEWVWDFYASDYYSNSPPQNPRGPDNGKFRVLRGGSWYDIGYNLRVTNRDWDDPTNAINDRGFRCARYP
jgi:formylglycine-generating enzyme required for sulfatase activity